MMKPSHSEDRRNNALMCSVIRNLRRRESFGYVTKHPVKRVGTASGRVFAILPTRLAFSLRQIVNESVLLEEAHVFLGFSKDGTFVISYTEHLETDNHTGFPSYVFRLHWWLFRLHANMKKCRTVRLFANEEIVSSLHLSYVEWPNEKSKVVVYGWGKETDKCYITVAAAPPHEPCDDCDVEDSELSVPCLKHSFVGHMVHTSVSTVSGVLNTSGLKIDNLLVLNMGHSIGVFSLGLIPPKTGVGNLPLSSIKRATYEDKPFESQETEQIVSSEKNFELMLSRKLNLINTNIAALQSISEDEEPFASQFSNSFQLGSSPDMFSPSTSQTTSSLHSPSPGSMLSTTSDDSSPASQCITLSDPNVSNKCSMCKQQPESMEEGEKGETNMDPYYDFEPKSIVLLPRETGADNDGFVSPFDICTAGKDLNVKKKYQNENCCCNYAATSSCMIHGKKSCNTKCANQSNSKSVSSQTASNNSTSDSQNTCIYCGRKLNKPCCNENTTLAKKINQASNPIAAPLCITSPSRNPSKLLIFSSFRNSRDDASMDLNAATPSPSASESSGSIYCAGDASSQLSLKSGSCRRTDGIVSFFETLYGPMNGLNSLEEPVPAAAHSLFYGPVTFEGVNGCPLNPVKCEKADNAVAYSQHLVLDVEHVIFDVLRTRCYTTYKFGYLIDYEVQIIDTCPSTRSVLILIVALLNVSPQKSKTKLREIHFRYHSNFEAKSTVLQQFHCFLCWRLQTGRYEVVAASPLQAYHEKKDEKWNASWLIETKNAIRRACAVPISPQSSVYLLNNAPVLQGKSLNLLWDMNRMVAIRK